MSTIGERIKLKRTSLVPKMTQAALAAIVGVSREAVSQWESGDSRGLKPDNLLATADALNCDIRWLITGKKFTYERRQRKSILEPPVYSPEKIKAFSIIKKAPDEVITKILPILELVAREYELNTTHDR